MEIIKKPNSFLESDFFSALDLWAFSQFSPLLLHYRRLLDGRSLLHEADRKKFYEEYDKKTEELDRRHNGEMSDILDFLYESDCSGEMDVKHCCSIYEIIKNYDDNICY